MRNVDLCIMPQVCSGSVTGRPAVPLVIQLGVYGRLPTAAVAVACERFAYFDFIFGPTSFVFFCCKPEKFALLPACPSMLRMTVTGQRTAGGQPVNSATKPQANNLPSGPAAHAIKQTGNQVANPADSHVRRDTWNR